MSLTVKQFLQSLHDSGLMSGDEVRAFWASLDPKPNDARQLAILLIQQNKLTKFQAKRINDGQADGLVFREYIIEGKIGAGGMGDVFKARHRRMKRHVAIKAISKQAVESPDAVARFHQEVEAAAALEHPNVVSAYDAFEVKGQHYLIMQYVDGQDLSDIVKQNGPLTVEQALECIVQAARGLEYAHEQGIIHRDIKPANLLLRKKDGRVKILDMGLARLQGGDGEAQRPELTNSGQIMGTVDYMSPEQAEDTRKADARTDIYALGCTLYRILTGEVPFKGETAMQKLLAHRGQPIPSLCAARPDVPQEIDAIYHQMLAKNPDARQASMTVVIGQLQECLQPAAAPPSGEHGSTDKAIGEFVRGLKRDSPTTAEDSKTRPFSRPDAETIPPQRRRNVDTPLAAKEKRRSKQELQSVLFAVGGVVVCLCLLAGAAGLIYWWLIPSEPQGTLVVQGPLDKVQLAAKAEDWERFRPLEPDEQGRSYLTPGKYELGLLKGMGSYELVPNSVEIVDGAEVKVEVVAKLPPPPPPPPYDGPNYALKFDESIVVVPTIKHRSPSQRTIEAWVRVNDLAEFGKILTSEKPVIDLQVGFRARPTIRIGQQSFHSNGELVSDEWHHLAAVWDGEQVRLFVGGEQRRLRQDGKQQGTVALSPPGLAELVNSPLRIGAEGTVGKINLSFAGFIDEVHISSVARYTKDFTPQNRFEPDDKTIALYHFDEGQGSTLTDWSGNGHHGKIHNATWVHSDGTPLEAPPKDWALEFDGETFVELKSPTIEPTTPTTVEVWVTPRQTERRSVVFVGPTQVSYLGDTIKEHLNRKWVSTVLADNGSGYRSLMSGEAVIADSRTHIASVIRGRYAAFFVNGKLQGDDANVKGPEYYESWSIASRMDGKEGFRGRIDELRISNTARYSEDFVPAKRFEPDEHTLALYHFDEGPGSGTTVIDASGNGHHGTIHGNAQWVLADGAQTGLPVIVGDWSEPVNLGPNVNSQNTDTSPALSADGLMLLFASNRAGGEGKDDLWMCRRPDLQAAWSPAENLGPPINSPANDKSPTLSADGKTLVFQSDRDKANGKSGLWESTRKTLSSPWSVPTAILKMEHNLGGPELFANGLRLFFHSRRGGRVDLWEIQRQTLRGPWGSPQSLGATINSEGETHSPALSSDGCILLFSSDRQGGANDIWMSTRASADAKWSLPARLGSPINTKESERSAGISANGRTLIYRSGRRGGQGGDDLWMSTRLDPPLAVAPFDEDEAQQHQQAWGDYLGLPVEKQIVVGQDEDGQDVTLTLMLIPPGEFMMGSSEEEQAKFLKEAKAANEQWTIDRMPSEGPQHLVRITRPFYLGKYEVTQAQWQLVMGNNPSQFKDNPTHPVERVSWDDNQPFLSKLNETKTQTPFSLTLPTEAQWEYACRAGTTKYWHSGDSEDDLRQYGWSNANSGGKTHSVGALRSNAFGLYDMHGNVWEWCADWRAADYYAKSPVDDPTGPSAGSGRVFRGGAWQTDPRSCRSAYRYNRSPENRAGYLGFRLAATIDVEQALAAKRAGEATDASSGAADNHALEFDGKSSYVQVDSLKVDAANGVTLEAWVVKRNRQSDDFNYLIKFGHPSQYFLLKSGALVAWNFFLQPGGENGSIYVRTQQHGDEPVHVAGCYDGEHMHIYVNGKGQRKAALVGYSLPSKLLSCSIGGQDKTHGHFNGIISQVRISSSARYTDDFTPTREWKPDDETLALYLMEEGQGDKLIDSSGNNHHGIIKGAKWVRVKD